MNSTIKKNICLWLQLLLCSICWAGTGNTVLSEATANVSIWGDHVYVAFIAAAFILASIGGILVALKYLDGDYRSVKSFFQWCSGLAVLGIIGYVANVFLNKDIAPQVNTVGTSGLMPYTGQTANQVGTPITFTAPPLPTVIHDSIINGGNAIDRYINSNADPVPTIEHRAIDYTDPGNGMSGAVRYVADELASLAQGTDDSVYDFLVDVEDDNDGMRGVVIDEVRRILEQEFFGNYLIPTRIDGIYYAIIEGLNAAAMMRIGGRLETVGTRGYDSHAYAVLPKGHTSNYDYGSYSSFWQAVGNTETTDEVAVPPIPPMDPAIAP